MDLKLAGFEDGFETETDERQVLCLEPPCRRAPFAAGQHDLAKALQFHERARHARDDVANEEEQRHFAGDLAVVADQDADLEALARPEAAWNASQSRARSGCRIARGRMEIAGSPACRDRSSNNERPAWLAVLMAAGCRRSGPARRGAASLSAIFRMG